MVYSVVTINVVIRERNLGVDVSLIGSYLNVELSENFIGKVSFLKNTDAFLLFINCHVRCCCIECH